MQISCKPGSELNPCMFAPYEPATIRNAKAASILDRAGWRGLQLKAIRAAASSPLAVGTVYLFHVDNTIPALDFEHSELSDYIGKSKRFAGKVMGVKRPCLNLK